MTDTATTARTFDSATWRARWMQASTALLLIGGILAIFAATKGIDSLLLTRFVTEMLIQVVLVLGLQVFMGNTNILWFPHIGFMGIGAYASVIFSMGPTQKMMSLPDLYPFLSGIEMGFLPSLLAGALIAAVIAAVVCFPLMRLSDFPAVIAGFALLVVIHVVVVQWSALTNGPQTLFGVDRYTYLGTATIWACIAIVAACLFKESRIGLQLRASREDLIAARTIGVKVMWVRWLALILSAFMAGLGGGLYAHYITSFMPYAFYLNETFVILSMLVIGGPGTVSGAVVGTILITIFYQSLRWAENSETLAAMLPGGAGGLSTLALALALIAVLIWRPSGIIAREELSWSSVKRIGSVFRR